jgi:recombination protein U
MHLEKHAEKPGESWMEVSEMKNPGKLFEQDWKNSVPEDIFYYRFRDGTASYYGGSDNENIRFQQSNICDCLMYLNPQLWLVDLKSHKGKSIPFNCFKDNQVKELSKAMMHEGVKAGFIVNFRDVEETYFIKANDIEYYIAHSERKSIPLDWCGENGIAIGQRKLKVRYRYNVDELLKEIV